MPRRTDDPVYDGDSGRYVSVDSSPPRAASLAAEERDELVALINALARTVQAFHTYPADSPACRDMADVVCAKVAPCVGPDEPFVVIDVTAEGLKVAGELTHGDRGPERALAITLRKAYVATIEIRAGVPARDVRQFCSLVAFPERLLARDEELPEILSERGVQHIVVKVIRSHQAVDAGPIAESLLERIRSDRETGRHLPNTDAAEGGWIRIDPSVDLDRVALDDLPILLQDAPALGVALHQISGHDRDELSPQQAMVEHFEEISELYAAHDASIADTLFRRLSQLVLTLPEEARTELLKEEVLPGLLDGRRTGSILGHFSEAEIADALWLLLDLGVGGVEMLSAGLAKLDLPESRFPDVIDHVSRRLESEGAAQPDLADWLGDVADSDGGMGIGDRLALQAEQASNFQAFRSLDLTVDEAAGNELEQIVHEVVETDPLAATLRYCSDILALSANPPVVASAMRCSRGLFFSLESRGDVGVLAGWLARFARIAEERKAHDAEVSAIILEALDQYVTPEFINRVSALSPEDFDEPPLVTIICALGATGVGALVDSLSVESDRSARSRLLVSLQPRAGDLAEHLVEYLSHPQWFVARNVLTLLGHAGSGWESQAFGLIEHEDVRVVREAFLALARMGTEEAARLTGEALHHASPVVRRHGADTVWRFEADLSYPLALEALADETLPALDPGIVRAILEGAGKRSVDGIRPVARRLRRHVLAFWSPERRALGRSAIRVGKGEA